MVKGFSAIFYGSPGVGKTTLAMEFPKPIDCFSCHETGLEDLIDIGEVDPKYCRNINVKDYGTLLPSLNRSDARTVVIDALNGLQRLLFDYCIQNDYGGSFDEFMDYWKGPRQIAPRYATALCSTLEELRHKGTNVIILSHETTNLVHNPKGLDYTESTLDIDDGIRTIFTKWASNIIYMTLDPGIEQVTKKVKGTATEAKVKSDDVRVFFTQASLVHAAKNKVKLPSVIRMGSNSEEAYDNLVSQLPEVYKEILM